MLTSIVSEQSVIGAALLDKNSIGRAAEFVRPEDFSNPEYATYWAYALKLYNAGKDVDVVTLDAAMGEGEPGRLADLAELARSTPSATNAVTYARIVSDLARRRRLLDDIENLGGRLRDTSEDASEALDEALERLSRIEREDSDRAAPIGRDLLDLVNEIDRRFNGEEPATGLTTGLDDLDRLTTGLHAGDMAILAGRPSMGKTALALLMAAACTTKAKRPAVVFSMEMDRKALQYRFLACLGNLPINAVKNPRDHMDSEGWDKLTEAVRLLKDAPLVIDDRPAMTIQQMRNAAKRWKAHYGDLGLIVVDYLQLMGMKRSSASENREQQVAGASRGAKLIAKETGCPVLVLSQLNRECEKRLNKRPMPSDLRESGSLEQDADIIFFLYREEVYEPDKEGMKDIAEIIVAKQREGSTGTVYARANLGNARFENMDRAAAEALRSAQRAAAIEKSERKNKKSFIDKL